jgi:cardiolipin synthase
MGWVPALIRHPWGRGAFVPLFTLCFLLAGPVRAHPEDPQIRRALERILTADETRAFTKGNHVRLYLEKHGIRTVFEARWKRGPLDGRGHAYHTAELEWEKGPPRMPGPRSAWHEATILGQDAWRGYLHRAYERLVPQEPGLGIYVQLLDSDRVMARDATGHIRFYSLKDKPPDTRIVTRYNAREFAIQTARYVESDLSCVHPAQTRFLGAHRSGSLAPRFILFDFSRDVSVLLHGPCEEDGEDETLPFSSGLSVVTSLILESHGLALLKNPVSCAGRLLNIGAQTTARLTAPRLPSFDRSVPGLAGTPGMDLVDWETSLDKMTGTKRDLGSIRFLIDGENFFPRFRRRLQQARRSVDLRVCIFDNDDVAVDAADLLKRLSGSVKVRVLLDLLSTQTSGQAPPATLPQGFTPPKSIRAYLQRDSRVKVRAALNPWLSSDHSKVFLIDGRFAYVGGMNIGREYRFEWHDMMVELEGPIVGKLQRDFGRAWAHASLLGDLAYAGSLLGGSRPDSRCPRPARDCIEIRRLYTRTGRLQIRKAVLEGIRRAESHVFLENPYFHENEMVAALAHARRRGVDVRVVLPRDTDSPGSNSSNFVTANYLLENGIRVYLYPGMTHIKALIIDGWACLGSANFNHLSLRLNQEVNVATSDPATVDRLRRDLFEVDFRKSHELRKEIPVGWTDHLVEELMNWF